MRLFEETASDNPVSQWSAVDSFDEEVSRPRIYRDGQFEFGERFGEQELFRFPAPIGQVGVLLDAQEEVVTVSHVLRVREMDAKIGGIDMERLRRWYRQGKLNRSRRLVAARFPATPTPRTMSKLVRRGIVRNECFAAAVLVSRRKRTGPFMIPVGRTPHRSVCETHAERTRPASMSGSLADCATPKYSARGSFEWHPPHEESDAPQVLRRDPRQLEFDLRRLVMKRGDLRTNETGKVLVPERGRADVGAGLKDDGLVFRQQLIDVHFHDIEIAERRHRAHLAIGEQVRALGFCR